ncbi:MAG: hypothetical protein R2717_09120 [Schumannella sp.]
MGSSSVGRSFSSSSGVDSAAAASWAGDSRRPPGSRPRRLVGVLVGVLVALLVVGDVLRRVQVLGVDVDVVEFLDVVVVLVEVGGSLAGAACSRAWPPPSPRVPWRAPSPRQGPDFAALVAGFK